jgi:type IV secretion system protein VirD4
VYEGSYSTHFDENAKILIRGYLDYLMQQSNISRNLIMLYHFMTQDVNTLQETLNEMASLAGRAQAAANQILRTGSDERGSILSTTFRQVDWLGDSHIQNLLSSSNFDLMEFLSGNTDIYVVLPSDQIKQHGRLFRMLLSLLMSLIVQAPPSALPQQKMLFLLEELAQLGYCPDVEQAIEVLRSRGVVIWAVFQSLKQIELYRKPDLFKGMAIKQILTTDDTDTMQWIQTLGGKKTVVTKTLSHNEGSSRRSLQLLSNSHSQSANESTSEKGVDLIPLNHIRELSFDCQYFFIQGTKPIFCKKLIYFRHPYFNGKYDVNPLT